MTIVNIAFRYNVYQLESVPHYFDSLPNLLFDQIIKVSLTISTCKPLERWGVNICQKPSATAAWTGRTGAGDQEKQQKMIWIKLLILAEISFYTKSNMLKGFWHRLNSWLERVLDYPGCDIKTLLMRKTIWIYTIGSLIAIVALTLGFLICIPRLTILINYGAVLTVELMLILILTPVFPKIFKCLTVGNLFFMILVTFIVILLLGGITSSAGLIFVGLSAVLSSIPLQDFRISISLFAIYILTILTAGILHPWLTIPDQMTPRLNTFIFMLNSLWMSAYLFSLVMNYISQQKELEQLEAKRLMELDKTRSKLITNITHEFRTPLTIIQGMTDLIRTKPKEWTVSGLDRIKTNSNILLRLVNQMLDLAKIETGAMPVHLAKGDITGYLVYLVELFRSGAINRKIDLRFVSGQNHFEMDFDADKLMHIVSNLISNALRFTPQGGTIEVLTRLSDDGKMFGIRVKDSGIGIEKEHLNHLFDRFYQVEKVSGSGGTGLGLALTKEMVELLNGTILVESTPGIGSIFQVQLPVSKSAPPFDPALSDVIRKEKEEHLFPVSSSGEVTPKDRFVSVAKPILLIVEDNNDVVLYLQAILEQRYRVEVAVNGRLGLEKAFDLIPDIILSDVMMPEMDGIELLEKVKSDFKTSHIPVVMLTAKADVISRLEGLEKGADAYLAKPFNEKELHIVLKNLVETRRKLHNRYSSLDRQPEPYVEEFRMEDAFMLKVRQKMEANLEDDEFGISGLCLELAVSRSQLYRKFKSLSNKTLADFFKSLRLHKARELFNSSDLNVSEVAFSVGFKNLSHFSREFTREFGKSPSEFKFRI
jgi:signal transduction histidine kinase/DNA-binding response OmpR family regulator